MLKNIIIGTFLLLLYPTKPTTHHTIRLKWNPCFENENWNYVQTGFLWNLSYLGARLDSGSIKKMIFREPDSLHFQLNLEHAGFNANALNKMAIIIDTLKSSQEYKKNGCIDMGRFIMVTQNSSWHYYEITGVYKNLDDFKKQYQLNNAPQYLVTKSGVTNENRLITIHVGKHWSDIAFMAEVGKIDSVTRKLIPTEVEVFDVMQNGQLRFAVYGEDGKLKTGSDKKHSIAGKPSKCMWCHESSVQPLFYGEFENPGYISTKEFLAYVQDAMLVIKDYRKTLHTEIDFNNTHQHTYSELNYTGFMNPTLQRVASELEIGLDEASKLLVNLAVHEIADFPYYYTTQPYFGIHKNLYTRKQIDLLLPYITARVPDDAVEFSNFEPNYFMK